MKNRFAGGRGLVCSAAGQQRSRPWTKGEVRGWSGQGVGNVHREGLQHLHLVAGMQDGVHARHVADQLASGVVHLEAVDPHVRAGSAHEAPAQEAGADHVHLAVVGVRVRQLADQEADFLGHGVGPQDLQQGGSIQRLGHREVGHLVFLQAGGPASVSAGAGRGTASTLGGGRAQEEEGDGESSCTAHEVTPRLG